MFAQRGDVRGSMNVGDQPVLTGDHDGFADGFMQVQGDLDLAEFDAEAVHLHLLVGAAAEFEDARWIAFREIAGAVNGICEGFGGPFRITQIAAAHADAGDAELADFSVW